jgi:hypothetical protein
MTAPISLAASQGMAGPARWQEVPRSRYTGCYCWWRRRTGIEPAGDAARSSLVLKTRGTTRNPDASANGFTPAYAAILSEHIITALVRAKDGGEAYLAIASPRKARSSGQP